MLLQELALITVAGMLEFIGLLAYFSLEVLVYLGISIPPPVERKDTYANFQRFKKRLYREQDDDPRDEAR